MPYQLIWAIFFLPVFSFLVNALILRVFFKKQHALAGYVTIACIGAAFILSLWALATVFATPGHRLEIPRVTWLALDGVTIQLGLLIDSLSAVMLVVVTLVSTLVQIYSQGYMHGDPGYQRYFAWMSLFTASMLGLVMADSLFLTYAFWEGVGLCSYLLIGFWFHRPSAANAAKKAFIVTRIGDVGFLLAILYLYFQPGIGTTDIETLHQLARAGTLSGAALTWAALGIFSGAAGKSAQFPLHVWLPDAMEGPTPVSSLIHAATMVAAGVYLVARTFPMFQASATASGTVALIGAFTAIFAASMGLVMNDIKRVVAYSTISQLGFMMLGLGAGSISAGIFHLFNHAFFKCLLFLGSGSVNHTSGTFNMKELGGLRKHMPWTYATFLVAALSLAGIWPLAGFWSKDEILLEASHQPLLFTMAMITVFMTAFYIFRALYLTFHGEYRGGAAAATTHVSTAHNDPGAHTAHNVPSASHGAHGGHSTLHESPPVMVFPMVVLAFLSIVTGLLNVTGGFSQFLGEGAEGGKTPGFFEGLFGVFTHGWIPAAATAIALAGIFLAYAMYERGWISPDKIGAAFRPVYQLLSRKYFMDELYERAFVGNVLYKWIFRLFEAIDKYVVDGIVNGLAALSMFFGRALRGLQSGQLQAYGLAIVFGLVIIVAIFYLIVLP
ncbi:MAG: NADH-quinone oxidoreductase subunit L [Chloroflexi bacterium]|nr:NADH-quinone oxidoreductase subunit L [Chloroflexota bacterium]